MDFFSLRQTPSFGLASGKHNVIPDVCHIENTKPSSKDSRSQNDTCNAKQRDPDEQHNRHHHFHSPFHRRDPEHHTPVQNDQRLHSTSTELRFIPAAEVEKADGRDGSPIWIVIDDIIYDVTNFANEHPGGAMPLRNLAGMSCSWQFHKIHSKKTIELHGSLLRVGQTAGVRNPHKEPRPGLLRQLWHSRHF